MDQPGNSHYSLNMSQQTLNGHGGYHGRGYEANGHEGNGREANGYACNGYADGMPPDHHAADGAPGTVADAGIEDGTQTSADGIDHDATVTDEGRGPADQDPADQDPADQDPADEDPADQDAGEPATDVAPDGLDGQDATGTADGEPAASGDSLNGTRAADRMRELLARSTVDHAATGRATAITLDGIRERLAGLEHAVAEIAERAEAERGVADRVAEQLAPQAQRLAGMSATLDGLTASLSTFRAQISGIDGRLAEADSRLAGADVKLASTEGRVTALDTRFERLDERLDDQYDRVSSIDERVTSIDGRVTSIGERVAAADGRIIALGGQFTDAIAPLADELRARPDRTEIEEVITKIVAAAHTDLSTRLTSLEDTVLTLAEALLRPAPGHAPGEA